jgi:hypothetical protein
MLIDHRIKQERWARKNRERRKIAMAFGEFLTDLASWGWFFNLVSFRDDISGSGPPAPDLALSRLTEYFHLIQRDAGKPIGWLIAEQSQGGGHDVAVSVALPTPDFRMTLSRRHR